MTESILAEDVPTWADGAVSEGDVPSPRSPFAFNADINKKLCLWSGPILQLKVDAIVNSTSETLDDQNELSLALMKAGGPGLREEVRGLGACRIGDVKVSKALNLLARFVFHTVGPRYNDKYCTAAESALYNCYRGVLSCLKEYSLKTLVCPAIHSLRR
jgi:O-acetyl-ADP-ribose deacetylase (regulator of RNase III)